MTQPTISFKPLYLVSLFVALNILSVAASTKVVSIFGWGLPGGSIIIALVTIFVGILAELYGSKFVSKITTLSLIMSWIWILTMAILVFVPRFSGWENQEAFSSIFGFSFRIGFAGLLTVLVNFNVRSFINSTKIITNKYLRNYTGSVISQLVDSVMFTTLAFYGTMPNGNIWQIMWQGFIIKMIIELVFGLFQPAIVNILKKYRFDSWTVEVK